MIISERGRIMSRAWVILVGGLICVVDAAGFAGEGDDLGPLRDGDAESRPVAPEFGELDRLLFWEMMTDLAAARNAGDSGGATTLGSTSEICPASEPVLGSVTTSDFLQQKRIF